MLWNHRHHEKNKVNYLRKVCKEAPLPQLTATVHCCPGQTEEYHKIPSMQQDLHPKMEPGTT
jgi:hypothetical protein